MKNEDDIFEEYALKRLMDDNDLGHRQYLDSAEFKLARSPSLEFLAQEVGLTVETPDPKWITEESSEESGSDYYRDEPERVYVITVADILQNRQENMERILQKLPKPLAAKIRAFEKDTTHLYAPAFSSKADVVDGLKNILKRSEEHPIIQRLVINHAKRIAPEPTKREQNALVRAKEKLAKKQAAQNRFYALIQDIHNPKNKGNRIELYRELLRELKNQNEDDVRSFLTSKDYTLSPTRLKKRLKVLKAHMTTELTRDIHAELYKLYKDDFRPEAEFFKQELDAYNKACNHYESRLLGPKGAFEKGGFYGPDSKFSGLIPAAKTPQVKASNSSIPAKHETKQEAKKEEKCIQLKIFDDADFEY